MDTPKGNSWAGEENRIKTGCRITLCVPALRGRLPIAPVTSGCVPRQCCSHAHAITSPRKDRCLHVRIICLSRWVGNTSKTASLMNWWVGSTRSSCQIRLLCWLHCSYIRNRYLSSASSSKFRSSSGVVQSSFSWGSVWFRPNEATPEFFFISENDMLLQEISRDTLWLIIKYKKEFRRTDILFFLRNIQTICILPHAFYLLVEKPPPKRFQ